MKTQYKGDVIESDGNGMDGETNVKASRHLNSNPELTIALSLSLSVCVALLRYHSHLFIYSLFSLSPPRSLSSSQHLLLSICQCNRELLKTLDPNKTV